MELVRHSPKRMLPLVVVAVLGITGAHAAAADNAELTAPVAADGKGAPQKDPGWGPVAPKGAVEG